MTDIDATLTDYAITVLCFKFSYELFKLHSRQKNLQTLWIVLFSSIALGSLFGGTVHGFFRGATTLVGSTLWLTTLLMIGITASTTWVISGVMLSGESKIRPWLIWANIIFFIYAAVVTLYSRKFTIVVVNYSIPMLLLLLVSGFKYLRFKTKATELIAIGVFISFIAAIIQQFKFSIHAEYFDYNATFHLIQAFALWLLYRGSRRLIV